MLNLESKTRSVFHKIHIVQGRDKKIFNRLQDLLNTDYLKEDRNFFVGKICLDAGCGSNVNATYAMLKMGARKVYAFDLDKSIMYSATKLLRQFKGRYALSMGNVLKIDFPDNYFDFTYCSNVLHHTANAFLGLKELMRVTKPGGVIYILIKGKGGLVWEITKLLRKKYRADKHFQRLIDGLTVEDLLKVLEWVINSMNEQKDAFGIRIPNALVKKLVNKDLILTIKDRITAPVLRLYAEKEIVKFLRCNGFINVKRLTRYPKIGNVRRFLSPFYYKHNHRYSRFLYGEGCIQLKAVKAK